MAVWWKNNFSVLYIVLALTCTNILANGPSGEPVFDPAKINETVVSDFPNEQLSVFNGNLEYLYRDVYIPGPNGMDVEVYRKFSQNYTNRTIHRHMPLLWSLEIPKLFLFGSSSSNRMKCFPDANSISLSMHGMSFSSAKGLKYKNSLPDGVSDNNIYFSNNSVLECRDNPILRLSDGRKVEFEQKLYDPERGFNQVVYYPNKITDRFGNTITYTYKIHNMTNFADGGFMEDVVLLQSITSPEGHKVTFDYVDLDKFPRISKINYLGKSIIYNYEREDNPKNSDIMYYYDMVLKSVTDEEGRKIVYAYNDELIEGEGKFEDYTYWRKQLKSVEFPQGAKITYSYEDMDVDTGQEVVENDSLPPEHNRMVKKKVIEGADIEDKRFDYSRKQYSYTVDVDIEERKDGASQAEKTTEYEFIRVEESKSNADSGKHAIAGAPKSIKVYDGSSYNSSPVHEKRYTWNYNVMGTIGCDRIAANYDVLTNEYNYIKCGQAVLDKEVEIFSGNTFTKIYSSHDVYGNPRSIAEYNVNATFNTLKTYLNDTNNWLIGLEESTSISKDGSSNNLISKIDYSSKSQPQKVYSQGELLEKTISYHSSGDINQITFNSKPGYIKYDNYKAGIAQTVTQPGRYGGIDTKTLVVDNEGRISKETDFNQNCINYNYDDIGRLTKIDYCGTKWQDVSISYTDYQPSNVSISLPSTVTKNFGTYKELSTLDSLGRVKSIKTTPVTGQTTYQSFKYDVNGRQSFKSFPSATSTSNTGTTYTYDTLGRIKTKVISETGTSRKWDYTSGNRVVYTDSNNKSTTTQYLRVADNTHGLIKNISAPQNSSTSIEYDATLNLKSVTQNNKTQANIYDSYGRLTTIVRKDIGTTNFGYATGQRLIAWEKKAQGDTPINYTYDNRGDLKSKIIGTGNTLLNQTLDKVGNLTNMSATGSQWSFDYNDRNLLEKETLAIDGHSFTLDWEYDRYTNISSVKYPNKQTISFNPNSFGQATTVGTYANKAIYHPIGSLKSFTYGNGIHRSIDTDAMGRTKSIDDLHENAYHNRLAYSYGSEHNLKSIDNLLEPDHSFTSLQYDGLNRLTGGNEGSMDIQYNENNDITYKKVSDKILSYNYDSINHRLSSVNGSINRSFSYDVRGNVQNNSVHEFVYNEDNQMLKGADITFTYDGFGNRIKKLKGSKKEYFMYARNGKLMYKTSDNIKNFTSFYYLGGQQVAKSSFKKGMDLDLVTDNLAWLIPVYYLLDVLPNTKLTYIHTDALGSIVAESDTLGKVIKSYHYTPYGKTIDSEQNSTPGYTGHVYDADLGLNYMKARYYDPEIGRFYSNDPVGFSADNPFSFNRYAYANNNPYKFVDPDGEHPLLVAYVAYRVYKAVKVSKWATKSYKLKIDGKAQKTKTAGHQFASNRIAIKEAKKSDVVKVSLDKGYNKALDLPAKTIQSNRRPDVTSVYKNKTVKRFEVKSKSDDSFILRQRNDSLNPQLIKQGFNPQGTKVIKLPEK